MFRALIADHQEVLELCCSVHRFFTMSLVLYGCMGGTRSRLQYWGITILLLLKIPPTKSVRYYWKNAKAKNAKQVQQLH
jgi:hypothetical protein